MKFLQNTCHIKLEKSLKVIWFGLTTKTKNVLTGKSLGVIQNMFSLHST